MATPMDTSRPRILLLSLESFLEMPVFDEMFAELINGLLAKAIVSRATVADKALAYLQEHKPTAIIAADVGIVKRKHAKLMKAITSYVRNDGRRILLACSFSSLAPPIDLGHWFASTWNLPWVTGQYVRTTVHLNPQARHLSQQGLTAAYSQKALFLKNVPLEAALYRPSDDSWTESHVFHNTPFNDLSETAIAYTPMGDGWLGYVGDVNNEVGSTKVTLAMCGL